MGLLEFNKLTWKDNEIPAITAEKLNRFEVGINSIVNEINNTKCKDFETFDAAIEQAEYRVLGENLVNAPYPNVIRGKLIVIVSDGTSHDYLNNTIWQFFYDNTGKIFYRYKEDGNAWSSNWYQVYSSQYKPTKADVNLGNVDNTSDEAKPVSTATLAALDGKSDTGHTHPNPSWADVTSKPTTFTPSEHDHDTDYRAITWVPSWADVTSKPTTFTPSEHDHDDLYYTENETNILLGGKSDTGHTHPYRPVTWVPSWADVTSKPTTFAPVKASSTVYGGIKISNVSGVLKIYT